MSDPGLTPRACAKRIRELMKEKGWTAGNIVQANPELEPGLEFIVNSVKPRGHGAPPDPCQPSQAGL